MSLDNHAYFQLSLKIILKKDGQILTLTTQDDYLDFPGGRIDESEADLPTSVAIERELAEELGNDIKFKVGELAFVTRRQYTKDGQTNKVLAIFYEVEYAGGEIKLSSEHTRYEWVDPTKLLARPNKYQSTDEHDQLIAYFSPK